MQEKTYKSNIIHKKGGLILPSKLKIFIILHPKQNLHLTKIALIKISKDNSQYDTQRFN